MEKLLYSKEEAMQIIGVGEKTFRKLDITPVLVKGRKKYLLEDLRIWAYEHRVECRKSAKDRRTTGMTLPSRVIGFAEVLKLATSKPREQSRQS